MKNVTMTAAEFEALTGWSFDEEVEQFDTVLSSKLDNSRLQARIFVPEDQDERAALSLHYFAGTDSMPSGVYVNADGYAEISDNVAHDQEVDTLFRAFAVIVEAEKSGDTIGACIQGVNLMYTPADYEKDGFWDIEGTDCVYSSAQDAIDDYLERVA